jgi:hypothetical protein
MSIFGFPGAPGLESQNLGLLDQRLATEWVRDNIAGFGGKCSKVSILLFELKKFTLQVIQNALHFMVSLLVADQLIFIPTVTLQSFHLYQTLLTLSYSMD